MDLLAKRYASPFSLLDKMISQGRFFEFVCEVNTIKNEEDLWDVWLHRVFDKTFEDWKKSIVTRSERSPTFDAKATVNNSFNILKGFNPENG